MKSLVRFASIVLLFSLLCPGQTASSLIQGNVRDSSGAALAGMKVTATLRSTETNYNSVTNADGFYVFPNIRPGVYTVTFESPSFKKSVHSGLLVEVNQQARVDTTMQVGEVAESISVTDSISTVDTFTSSLSETVDSRRIVELPLNGRQSLQLQGLVPGVIPAAQGQAASFVAVNTNLTFSINGSRPSASVYTLDGGVNMDMYNNTPNAFPNPDAIQEFSILTNNYTAVQGGAPGGAVNMITKSGGNAFHGRVYEFFRNDHLNTRNFFAAGKPPLKKNQFGGNLGGPILQNRTFFFGAFESNRERRGITNSGNVVPTALERAGDFSQSRLPTGPVKDPLTGNPFPNNVIPANRIDTVAKNFASNFLPLPNLGTNQLTYNLSIPYSGDQFTGRLDHNLNERSRLMLRYFLDDTGYRNNDALLSFNSAYNWVTHNATLSHQYTFNPTTTNTATFTFNRNTFIRSPLTTPGAANWAALGCVSCVEVHPSSVPTDWNLSVTGGVGIRSSTAFLSYMQNFQFVDSFSKTMGNHLLSIGGSLLHARRNGREYFSSSPTFNFDGSRSASGSGYADFFLGLPITVGQNTILQSYTSKWTPSLFFEDDWKLSRKLTLNLGVRWEPYLPMGEKNNRLMAFVPGQQSTVYPTAPLGLVFPGDKGISNKITPNEWNKFAPRIGFAYDPFGNGRTSIRGGYGIFYDSPRLVPYNTFSSRQPYSVGTTLQNPYSLTDPYRGAENIVSSLLQNISGVPAGQTNFKFVTPVSISTIDPGFTNGYLQQWNFNLQREVVKDFVATAAYVGSKGTHMQIPEEINGAPYAAGATSGNINQRRIYQPFATIQSLMANGNSTYHSTQLSLKKRFGSGYSILSSYSFSKFIDMVADDSHGGTTGPATNPFNYFYDRGISDLNVRHRFVTSAVWELPIFRNAKGFKGAVLGGWQMNGIVILQSGTPFSVTAGVNRSLSGGAGDRADLIGSGSVATYGDTSRASFTRKYFDTSRFALPGLGSFGTAGRNLLTGPGLFNIDASAFKSFRFTERLILDYRLEIFNVLNRPNFGNPVGNFSSGTYGQITSAKDPRIMQMGLKLNF
ncbi:TonB-dependent receptor [Bryobacter aggregatus]|uniref:TonB-dependent receptor n=1 Tax=Bryobacter aggregatus TaxID=360054 RepID=UPI0004E17FC5|nr:carboxypeptidase regulatory-like domain-containing protein [Bryobacter aggregatus]